MGELNKILVPVFSEEELDQIPAWQSLSAGKHRSTPPVVRWEEEEVAIKATSLIPAAVTNSREQAWDFSSQNK